MIIEFAKVVDENWFYEQLMLGQIIEEIFFDVRCSQNVVLQKIFNSFMITLPIHLGIFLGFVFAIVQYTYTMNL